MKIVLSTIGKFHSFDLARELHSRGLLSAIATGYPRFKLKGESLPDASIKCFPWVHGAYMAFPWRDSLPRWFIDEWENIDALSFSAWISRAMPPCDVFVGLSGSALKLGERVQSQGGSYVCDRGSSHIRKQDELLREEYEHWGARYEPIDRRVVEREEREYSAADAITVPSQFVLRSFLEKGVPEQKLRLLPYGVNLERFNPVAPPDSERFDVLFVGGMSLRKGVQYLVQAYEKLNHPRKSLTFVGAPSKGLIELLRRKGLWPADAQILGHVPQHQLKEIMSRSHVLVLPSIEEGLAMVQAQALACGCPVIGTTNSGAEDLLVDGVEGAILPIRDVERLREALQALADDRRRRDEMSTAALSRVRGIGGWRQYGDQAVRIYQDLRGLT